MIGQISLRDLTAQVELIPQAIIKEPVRAVARRLNVDYERGCDDFDLYEGIGIILDGRQKFALMHYQGHPANTFTIYLPHGIRDVGRITKMISRITEELKISKSLIEWQRKDNPLL